MPIRPFALISMYNYATRPISSNFLFAVLALYFATHAIALKETPLGRFDVSASLSTEYDSRVFGISSPMYNQILDSNTTNPIYALNEIESEDDVILRFTPAIHYTKKLRWFTFSGSTGVQVARFIKNEKKSYVQPTSSFSIDFDESLKKRISNNARIRFDMTFDLGQKVETSVLEQDLVSYTYFTTGANIRYNHSPKFGVGAGTSWNYRTYQGDGATGGQNNQPYQDLSTLPIYARAFYIYSEKLDFFSEYNYSKTKSHSGDSSSSLLDSSTHGISLGVQGELSPKLTGNSNIGYVRQIYDGPFPGQGSLSLGSGLQWVLNRKSSVSFNLNRGFTPSAQGYTMLNTSGSISLNHRFTDKVSGSASISYGTSDYTYAYTPKQGHGSSTGDTRSSTMDNIGFGLNLSRKLNEYLNLSGGYNFSYFDRGTPFGTSENYNRHLIRVDLNGRF